VLALSQQSRGNGKMTILQKAKQITKNGFNQSDFERFIDATKKDVVDYIAIFGMFGVSQDTVWNAYEEWQTKIIA